VFGSELNNFNLYFCKTYKKWGRTNNMFGRRKKIGIALGAGGARGIAHIGVLRVFESRSIPIDILVGTSIGALVGGAFASGIQTSELAERVDAFLKDPIFLESSLESIRQLEANKKLSLVQKIQGFFKNRFLLAQALFRPGMLEEENFQAMIDFFIPDIQIQDTLIPFRAVAVDLVAGKPVVFSSGSLREAVMASCAVPGAVSPHPSNGMLLADGGILYMVPTTVARAEGAEVVVAVGVNPEISSAHKLSSAVDVYVRATNVGIYHNEQRLLQEADVVILPNVGDLHWTDFGRATDLIAAGEKATREKLPQIRKALPIFRRWSIPGTSLSHKARHVTGTSTTHTAG
jgi:NTE family protein